MAGERGDGGYARPRIVLAFALTTILGVLLLADATRTDYAMSELTLTVLVGSVLTLLGIEVHELLRGDRR